MGVVTEAKAWQAQRDPTEKIPRDSYQLTTDGGEPLLSSARSQTGYFGVATGDSSLTSEAKFKKGCTAGQCGTRRARRRGGPPGECKERAFVRGGARRLPERTACAPGAVRDAQCYADVP